MQADLYFGTYAQFNTASKKDAAKLLGADNLVGDSFEIVFETTGGARHAWMKNRFGSLVGFFDDGFSRELSILAARGWKMQALLSFVAFTDRPEPGHYWGQAAVVCFEPSLEQVFSPFLASLSSRLADGIRPTVDLGNHGVEQVIASKGQWKPKDTIPMPANTPGTVIMKSRRKMLDKIIERGRRKNKGCYLLSWLFIILVLAAVFFILKSCGVL